MQMKKKFVSPRVVQQVQIHLEKDLLQGRSVEDNTMAIIEGHRFEDHDVSYMNEDIESYWE